MRQRWYLTIGGLAGVLFTTVGGLLLGLPEAVGWNPFSAAMAAGGLSGLFPAQAVWMALGGSDTGHNQHRGR